MALKTRARGAAAADRHEGLGEVAQVASSEIELKLLASKADLAVLREVPSVARNARDAEATRRLNSVYYDTPDCALFRNGLTLRVRRIGRRYVQTLKSTAVAGQPLVRGEWEAPLDGAMPDLARLPAPQAMACREVIAGAALAPTVTTKVRRRTRTVAYAGSLIEVAFDEGMVEANGRREGLYELELELKAGEAAALYGLGLDLLERAPLRLSTLSKAHRGYAMVLDRPPAWAKAASPAITAGESMESAFAALLGACHHHLVANHAAAEDGRDPEGVHQMRVALRRLRTLLSLFRKALPSPDIAPLAAEAKWLTRVLAPARNWDVFIADLLPAPAAACGFDLSDLRVAAERHRAQGRAAVAEALADVRYTRFVLSLGSWIEHRGWRNGLPGEAIALLSEPCTGPAADILARQHRRVLKRGAHFGRMTPEERHELRLALKKLRYAADFFAPLYANQRKTKPYLSALSRLQDVMGRYNDAATTRELLGGIGSESMSPQFHEAIGAVVGWHMHEAAACERKLRRRWRGFRDIPTFW
ncbi:CHAD domain-containing protein [Chelatococcus sp. SYSU_G07232]|uniref:CHAD domain-containing protein n=1 Tax=Chelatococcus albus TaxID=3047466 RepID=A0ABT7ACH1_9HYPH|nr:CYTH and CHAD domain-containing protein [Chelatococcus sp. SYSU_G07232]MDJ1157070.1 CHAD domain-containing protein [Chelatococcus sp. SYSU_G07232]